ncbi:hypothetical protein B4O97_03395 [Marispirochaeta aestuarii]|uniref:Uncharacterized protein n=1 Tax=Marispirochaeta aestuarii TaxID=1963862 RepID=A0A1Y1S1D6_9SPIO|nr:hypothetical protein [Marispirochaeta aestuarii]ORC37247.1 hypothetical protein B4O97_03395 [Marispirochaeta aestuarii]
MSKSNTFENELLLLLLNNTNIANVGDATGLRGSSAAGVLYVSLHTADPGEAGNQSTSEADYTGYGRVSVARTSGGWTVTGNAAANAAAITFGACTGGTNAITYFGIGTSETGTGKLLYSGALSATLNVSNGITPEFGAGELDITED